MLAQASPQHGLKISTFFFLKGQKTCDGSYLKIIFLGELRQEDDLEPHKEFWDSLGYSVRLYLKKIVVK